MSPAPNLAAASQGDMVADPLDALFFARSVALVGVSADPKKLNGIPLRHLQRGGFKGAIYPVNPKYDEIDGLRCYPSLTSLPEAPDVVLVMVQASDTAAVVDEAGRRGARAIVVMSSGFEETEGGKAFAAETRRVAAQYNMPLLGPNCEGLWSVRSGLVLTFGSAANRDVFHHAPISIVSQSGAVAGALARQLQNSGHGCAYVASMGNETCLDALDVLAWMIRQDDVHVVLLFIEGLRDGARLLELAQEARRNGISIVALKSGNSALGKEAASSHTGKIASAYAVYNDVFEQCGIIQVGSIAELVEAGEILATMPRPRRRPNGGIAIFSISGGTRALTADLCDTYGLHMSQFEPETVAALEAILPAFAHAQNPTDLTGQVLSRPELFEQALEIVAREPNTEALVLQFANRGPSDIRSRADMVANLAQTLDIPIIVSFLADILPAQERREMARRGMVAARDPADAVRYLSWLYRAAMDPVPDAAAPPASRPVAPPASTGWLDSARYLDRLSIDSVASVVVGHGQSLPELLSGMAGPFVVKALPEQVEHKTELGLVEVGLRDLAAVGDAVERIRAKLGDAHAGVLVQQMIFGVETVLSVIRDPDFGPVLVIGTGGRAVELWNDVGYLALPTNEDQVRGLIGRLKLSRLLAGFRGAPRASEDAFVKAALALANAAGAETSIREIELNPFIVLPEGQGAAAVDILIQLNA